MMHPQFEEIIAVAEKLGLGINLVTNGTLAKNYGENVWGRRCFRQVTISAHSLICFNGEEQIRKIAEYAKFAKDNCRRFKVSFRLRGPLDSSFVRSISAQIIGMFRPISDGWHWNGSPVTLSDRIFLNHGDIFSWRGIRPPQSPCLGLRHHFGILSDGTVVPCCADYDGKMAMGNVLSTPLADILNSQSALNLRRAIEGKSGPVPDYCRGCGFIMP